MTVERMQLHTSDGPMETVLAKPEGHPRGAVLVMQEAFGLTDHIADICQRLADAGWVAIAPALFHRQSTQVFDYADLPSGQAAVKQLTPDSLRTDVIVTLEYLNRAGFDDQHIATVGFCVGGVFSFWAATIRSLSASVTFYGSGIREGRAGLPPLVELALTMRAPWVGFYGDQDPSIPVDQVEELHKAMIDAPVHAEVIRYPEAGHGFNCDARPDNYHPASAKDAWARTLDFFNQHVKAPGEIVFPKH